MEKKTRRIPLGWICLLALLLGIGAAVFSYAHRVWQVQADFQPRSYADEPSFWGQEGFRKFLESLDVDLTVPATGGAALTFTSPKRFTVTQYGQEETVKRGTTLSCDFVSWSGNKRGERFLTVEVDGKTKRTYVTPKLAAKLYMAALEQNGLAGQFQQETGEKLTYRSAREALRGIDRQIYDLGVYMPQDYPFDRSAYRAFVLLVSGSMILIVLVLLMVVPELVEYLRYRAWLVDYNRDNSSRWAKVEGNLPQFVSLQENAGGGKPLPVYQKPGFVERMKRLFSPVARP